MVTGPASYTWRGRPMPGSTSHLLDKHQASELLSVSPRRLGDPAWRRRFGVPAIRVGGSLRFDAAELRQWLEACREHPDARGVA
jgi:hypothetical protein